MLLAFLAALAVFILRLVLFSMDRPPEGTDLMLVHFLAIVTVVFFAGQQALGRDRNVSFPDLMRDGFKSAALYALLTGVLLLAYYSYVEPEHFHQRVEEMVQRGMAEGQPEEIIRPRLEKFFTPFNYASITFFALLAIGGMQALVIAILHHKLLRRYR